MQLRLPQLPFFPLLVAGLSLLSCDKDLTSSEDQPLVDYIVVVTDSVTGDPVEDVLVRVTAIDGDTATYRTDEDEGRVELMTVASSQTLFEFTKPGFRRLNIRDTVNAKPDSIFHRPIQRLLNVKLVNLDPDRNRAQLNILLRDEELRRIRGGVVTLTDSLGNERPFSDHDTDGTVALSRLKVGRNPIRVEKSGYLGRRAEVTWAKPADPLAGPEAITLRLLRLDHSITGQVYRKTATGSEPLLDAKVEFRIKDSAAVDPVFRTYTSSETGDAGRFRFQNVPGLEGELWFYKNRTSMERTKVLPVTREEVLLDGPIPLVTLTIAADSLLPLLVSGPRKSLPGNDTVTAKDTLEFKFNGAMGEVLSLKVRLINESELLIRSGLSPDKTVLKVWQHGADWIAGKKYEYEMAVADAQGERFSIPGDSSRLIRGSFTVRVDSAKADTNLIYPREITFAYFNSGSHYRFGPADTNTSPQADSSSEFARLVWKWDTRAAGRKVDSLVVFFKDGKSAVNWTRWGALPGFLDSANLVFSDHYSTLQMPSQKARFPLRDSAGEIFFRIIPKHAGILLESKDTILGSLTQQMGPTVYAHYSTKALKAEAEDVDTLEVTFGPDRDDPSVVKAWGDASLRPTPRLYLNDKSVDTSSLKWRWKDAEAKTGQVIYRLPGVITVAPEIRVDLNGVPYLGRPIWMRNPHDKKTLPK